jgi:hypothetical protein
MRLFKTALKATDGQKRFHIIYNSSESRRKRRGLSAEKQKRKNIFKNLKNL